MKLTLASYNIHRCHGRDGSHAPARIREVLRQTGADVVALQEVELLREEPGLLEFLCSGSPWAPVHGPTLERRNADYGNALLTSLPLRSVNRIDISQPGREPRGVIEAVLQAQKTSLRVLATHLGLWPAERRAQVQQLLDILRGRSRNAESHSAAVLMGDLNEWFLWGRPLRRLAAHFKPSPAPATFPSRYPVFALDRIWAQPAGILSRVRVLDTPLARMASDHLPLVAELEIADTGSGAFQQAPQQQGDNGYRQHDGGNRAHGGG
jgi:endonuclease/exonuclease/phosphatase family metal-dependent hydrolase